MDDTNEAAMTEVLTRLIDKSPDGAVEAQLVVAGGMYAGAIRKHTHGVFEILTQMPHKNGKLVPIQMFIRADRIDAVMLPGEEPAVKPVNGSGLILGSR